MGRLKYRFALVLPTKPARPQDDDVEILIQLINPNIFVKKINVQQPCNILNFVEIDNKNILLTIDICFCIHCTYSITPSSNVKNKYTAVLNSM
jgi:hypothetical protein